MNAHNAKTKLFVAGLAALTLLSGCATQTSSPDDPYEGVNRKVHAFNNTLDEWVLLPVTRGYRAVTPEFAQQGVSNVIDNVAEPGNTLNNVLSGRINAGIETTFRFLVNTTFGLGGLFDVASWIGMEKHPRDFGQTLGSWGVPAGPYLVLPLLGPSGARDVWSVPVSIATNPMTYILSNDAIVGDYEWPATLGWVALTTVERRSRLIDSGADELRVNAVDDYSAVRDAYRRLRERSIYGVLESGAEELKRLTPLVHDDE